MSWNFIIAMENQTIKPKKKEKKKRQIMHLSPLKLMVDSQLSDWANGQNQA